MKLAIVTCINGNFKVEAEGFTAEQAALVSYHGTCQTLWNTPEVLTGEVAIVDEQLDIYHGCKELIRHTAQQPAPTPEPTPETESEDEGKAESGLITEE